MRRVFINFAVILFCLFVFSISNKEAFAANTIMGFSPQSGSFSKPFTVDLIIDGHGDKFNAAQATVNIPSNLTVQNLVLGDCNFSFLHTPSIQDPSFEGVRVASASTKCTVYKITLAPKEKGNATLSLSKTAVKRYGDAAEVLSSTNKGSYTLTGVSSEASPTSEKQGKSTSQDGLYTVYLKVYTNDKTPATNASVSLSAISMKKQLQATTDNTGTAHFSNLQAGVYDAIVKQGFNKVGETIINVSGSNHILTLGINLETQQNNPLMKTQSVFSTITTNPLFLLGSLVVGVIVGVVIAFAVIKILGKKKVKT